MSGRKTVGRKAKEKPPSKAKTSVQTRTRRAAKLTLNTSDFEADSNAIKDTTREKRSKKKSVESSTDIEESVLCTDKSQDNVKVLERRNIRKRSNVNIAAQRQSIMSSEGLEKNEHSSTEQSSTEQSSSIVATTSRKRANKNSDFSYSDGDEEHVNIVDVDFDAPVSPKKKRAKKTASVPRKRKLRPEDQRTLQILMEKFKFTEHGASCEVPSCQSNLKTTRPANLKRHLAQVHPQLYANLFPHEMDSKKMAKLEAFNAVQDAIELVTVNGYPFSLLNASGMRGFVKSRVQPLRLDGEHIEINRLDIVKKVAEMSDIIRKRIQSELKGKTVSLMFDMCTIATLATFGVNVTYMENGKVVCRSLGVIKIEKRHTAVNLADMLFDMLAQYEIPLSKVFSITTDTAKNATNTSEVLNMVMENSNENPEDGDEDFIYDEEDQNELDFGLDHENVAELQKVINSAASHTALAEATASGIRQQNDSIRLINQINCGTHVLQLAINDALDETNATELISLVKKMCLLMRTQIVTIAIRQLGSKIILPPLDNATRWNSKYLMCRGFLKVKELVKELSKCADFGVEFVVNEEFWENLEEVVAVLKPAYNVTIDMQRIGYSLSDFYISWIRITKNLLRIQANGTEFDLAAKLKQKMEHRSSSLFRSPLMLCAIYLDPRIMFKLTDTQKATAALDLLDIYKRLAKHHMNEEKNVNDTLDEIQEEYHEQNIGSRQDDPNKLLQEMSVYELEKPHDIKATVMNFWELNAVKYPLLSPLADVLHAVPSNQSCTERSFSSFSYIRSKHRMAMSAENLSNVLMVRLNKDIFYSERKAQVEKILSS